MLAILDNENYSQPNSDDDRIDDDDLSLDDISQDEVDQLKKTNRNKLTLMEETIWFINHCIGTHDFHAIRRDVT